MCTENSGVLGSTQISTQLYRENMKEYMHRMKATVGRTLKKRVLLVRRREMQEGQDSDDVEIEMDTGTVGSLSVSSNFLHLNTVHVMLKARG
jgi:hypothetical protein